VWGDLRHHVSAQQQGGNMRTIKCLIICTTAFVAAAALAGPASALQLVLKEPFGGPAPSGASVLTSMTLTEEGTVGPPGCALAGQATLLANARYTDKMEGTSMEPSQCSAPWSVSGAITKMTFNVLGIGTLTARPALALTEGATVSKPGPCVYHIGHVAGAFVHSTVFVFRTTAVIVRSASNILCPGGQELEGVAESHPINEPAELFETEVRF
jgi:hypothetical protein